jgi:hypothetical protein
MPMENKAYTHILQKKGILKTFQVAKVVRRQDIDELKDLIKKVASDEEEYNLLLKEEMAKLSNMHDETNPIPGIIYGDESIVARRNAIFTLAQKITDGLKKQKFTKQELALLISSVIAKLDLEQEDFMKLNEELNEELDEGEDDDSEYED